MTAIELNSHWYVSLPFRRLKANITGHNNFCQVMTNNGVIVTVSIKNLYTIVVETSLLLSINQAWIIFKQTVPQNRSPTHSHYRGHKILIWRVFFFFSSSFDIFTEATALVVSKLVNSSQEKCKLPQCLGLFPPYRASPKMEFHRYRSFIATGWRHCHFTFPRIWETVSLLISVHYTTNT